MELLANLSQSKSPWFNQAVEEVIFDSVLSNKIIMLIWQNRQSISIGRDQNPWHACNIRHAHKNKVSIIRRQTPGGAIYQDPSHTNFSLIGSAEHVGSSEIKVILDKVLTSLQINAGINQQLELITDNRKISNTAVKTLNGNTVIHSAIKVSTNLSTIDEYMNSGRVTTSQNITDNYSNLCELGTTVTHGTLQQALIGAFSECYNSAVKVNQININPLPEFKGLGEKLHLISSWDWNYGQSPTFTHQLEGHFSWGRVNLSIHIIKGTIAYIQCHSAQRYSALFDKFCNRMIGFPFQAKSVMPVICTMMIDFSSKHTVLLDFACWLEKELS